MTRDTSRLTNVAWYATQGLQSDISTSSDGAARYLPDVSPFAALETWGSLTPLRSVVDVGQGVGLLSPNGERHEIEEGWQEVGTIPVHQMICHNDQAQQPVLPSGFRQLGFEDRQAMLEIAKETDPGPFELNTWRMGEYFGIEQDGRLVAMAGERLRMDGWTEISGVCTLREARGKGYAQVLVRYLQARHRTNDISAFLHVRLGSESEMSAIRAYEKVGFSHHRQTLVQLLARTS